MVSQKIPLLWMDFTAPFLPYPFQNQAQNLFLLINFMLMGQSNPCIARCSTVPRATHFMKQTSNRESGPVSRPTANLTIRKWLLYQNLHVQGRHHPRKAKRPEIRSLTLTLWPLLDDADLVQGDIDTKVTSLWLD